LPVHHLVPEQALAGRDASKVQANELARPARVGSACGFCGRPLFGAVAYCPYCGRKPSFTAIGDEVLESGTATRGMPAGGLHRPEARPPRKEPRATPVQGVPILGSLPGERDSATPSQLNKTTVTLLFKIAAIGVSALLLFWMAVKLPGLMTHEGASPRLPISSSGVVSPMGSPSTSAAQKTPPVPQGTDIAPPPQANRRSLCSAAHEAAGLCKSQQ
jgi:hypothetical protein